MSRKYENPSIEVTRIWQETGVPTVRTFEFETQSLEESVAEFHVEAAD